MRKTEKPHLHAPHAHTGSCDHAHSHGHLGEKGPRALQAAVTVTAFFMIVELGAGWISNSLALMSDGVHMLTDVGALLLSLFALWIARRPYSKAMTFGYHRAEILGALISGLAIWTLAGLLVFEAFQRIQSPPAVQGKMVVIVAFIGLLANLFSMSMLHHAKDENINLRGAYLHVLSDALGSIAAIISGLVIWLTDWRLIDPIITVFFAILMLVSSWKLLREAVEVLMESTPSWIDSTEVAQRLRAIDGVVEIHDLHIWTVSTGRLALSVHLIAPASGRLLQEANRILKEHYGIIHTTIQIEDPEHFRHEGCYDCTLPS